MIPIGDENPIRIFPYVTLTLVILNVLVFVYELSLLMQNSSAFEEFIFQYGAVPEQLSRGSRLHTIFTSMFLHGDIGHIVGNMLFLWIFGDNIEQLLGHFRYLGFYLLCGFVALFSHYIFDPMSVTPMIGASGAISGVLGAYWVKFPRAQVKVLWFLFFFITISRLPAGLMLGLWFFFQIFSAMAAPAGSGGVAWYAHIGGFLIGVLLISRGKPRNYIVYH